MHITCPGTQRLLLNMSDVSNGSQVIGHAGEADSSWMEDLYAYSDPMVVPERSLMLPSASSQLTMRSHNHALATFARSSPNDSSFVPGTISMEQRYANLLCVINEATMRFPESQR